MLVRFGVFFCLLAAVFPQAYAGPLPLSQEFPFRFSDGLIRVEARVSSSDEPLNFLLDSGASFSVLNMARAEKLVSQRGKESSVQGLGGIVPGFWANDLTIQSGNVALPENYLAVDLDRLSGDSHCNVDGLIGADFFRGRIVQIDFVAQKIRVLSRVTAAPSGNIFRLKIAASGALLVPARINEGRTEWLRLDTGCAASLQWVTRRPGAQEKSQQFAVGLSTSVILQTHTTVQ